MKTARGSARRRAGARSSARRTVAVSLTAESPGFTLLELAVIIFIMGLMLTLAMAAVIVFMMLAVLMPIFQLNQLMQ